MTAYLPLLSALAALLIGLALGKAWERYKLRDGRWIDRRKIRESPHYIHGLNFLITDQLDLAIEELSQAARADPDAVDVQMILGNLHREKGQVRRAIQMHQQLLRRERLTQVEHGYLLLCLGLDFRRAGFVDRALAAFNEVLKLEPQNQYALRNLEKLYEDQHQWAQAHAVQSRLAALAPAAQQPLHQTILAFLENELGLEAVKQSDLPRATRHFEAAIELDPAGAPGYLNLGDVHRENGNVAGAVETWERLIEVDPGRAHLAFDRLADAYAALGRARRFEALCRRLIAASPQDWRSRIALARHLGESGSPREELELVLEALELNPHAFMIHHAAWRALRALNLEPAVLDRYIDISREAVFYQDPHICLRCRYRSNELLWKCPHCHEWNTFVEERITPAKDREESAD